MSMTQTLGGALGLAKIDLALASMADVDKLVALNEALRCVLCPER
jgi:hypothetical protein